MTAEDIAMQNAFRLIQENAELADFERGASEGEIEAAERSLNIRFPPSYRTFLSAYGVGDFNGREFFGIIPGKIPGTSAPSVVWLTLDERKVSGLPTHLLPVAASGYGSYFCIDTSNTGNNGSPILEWSNSHNPTKLIAGDFAEFFLDELQGSLS
ncbi:SMI1/KNR4 family protein [Aureimonas leprariae]|uniref:SMI1/KNR4 family protein n=1 Tax=Plantimonas leprariae TaxID=2615207 RepID=A0A7V7PLQ0_9HYPH|nr:SMI1/KNR4 family protein [Aureimonas leprariae]KAB0677370.1 SMI1/KNR4 family protein [Aureimonas leprariae]